LDKSTAYPFIYKDENVYPKHHLKCNDAIDIPKSGCKVNQKVKIMQDNRLKYSNHR